MDLEGLLARGERELIDAVASSLAEDLHLDFKRAGGAEPIFNAGALTRSGRRVIARALSGFSNSDGGLVVIGVDCRNVDGVDAATSLDPIESLDQAFSSRAMTGFACTVSRRRATPPAATLWLRFLAQSGGRT